MNSAPFDLCFLYQTTAEKLTRVVGLAIDESVNTGAAE